MKSNADLQPITGDYQHMKKEEKIGRQKLIAIGKQSNDLESDSNNVRYCLIKVTLEHGWAN